MTIKDSILSCAAKYNLDPKIIACIIIQESDGNPYAFRYEPKFYKKYLENNNNLSGFVPKSMPNLATEKLQRACSFGLMQILGETARSIGKNTLPFLIELCDIEDNIDCGCRVLRYYMDKMGNDYFKALTRYNGSSAYAVEIMERMAKKEYLRYINE